MGRPVWVTKKADVAPHRVDRLSDPMKYAEVVGSPVLLTVVFPLVYRVGPAKLILARRMRASLSISDLNSSSTSLLM